MAESWPCQIADKKMWDFYYDKKPYKLYNTRKSHVSTLFPTNEIPRILALNAFEFEDE